MTIAADSSRLFFCAHQNSLAFRLQVLATFTGNVWDIKVEEGSKVEANDEVLVLEAMKMEHPVLSPSSGVVKKVKVSQG